MKWVWPWHQCPVQDPDPQLTAVRRWREEVSRLVRDLQGWGDDMQQWVQDLTVEVGEMRTVAESVKTTVDKLVVKLAEVGDHPTPEQMQALRADLQGSREIIAGAVTKGTIAEGEPPA